MCVDLKALYKEWFKSVNGLYFTNVRTGTVVPCIVFLVTTERRFFPFHPLPVHFFLVEKIVPIFGLAFKWATKLFANWSLCKNCSGPDKEMISLRLCIRLSVESWVTFLSSLDEVTFLVINLLLVDSGSFLVSEA